MLFLQATKFQGAAALNTYQEPIILERCWNGVDMHWLLTHCQLQRLLASLSAILALGGGIITSGTKSASQSTLSIGKAVIPFLL